MRKCVIDKLSFYGIMRNMKNNANKNEQLKMEQTLPPLKTCAFTGHRKLEEDFSEEELKKVVKCLIEEGVETFYCGMAAGFDLYAAEAVLSYKNKYPNIRLIACIPCENQEKSYVETDKKRYVEILKNVEEKVQLYERYFNGCMLVRNRYMADRADILVAYFKNPTGGTAYTVKYYREKYPLNEIIFL